MKEIEPWRGKNVPAPVFNKNPIYNTCIHENVNFKWLHFIVCYLGEKMQNLNKNSLFLEIYSHFTNNIFKLITKIF